MEIPTYSSDKRRHTKFRETTVPVSFRLPITMAQSIKDNNWDLGQFVFNFLSNGKLPVINSNAVKTLDVLVQKLIALMMNENVVAPDEFFTPNEITIIRRVAEELVDES